MCYAKLQQEADDLLESLLGLAFPVFPLLDHDPSHSLGRDEARLPSFGQTKGSLRCTAQGLTDCKSKERFSIGHWRTLKT